MTGEVRYGAVRGRGFRGELALDWQGSPLLARAGEVSGWIARGETIKADAGRLVLHLRPGAGLPDLLGKLFTPHSMGERLKQRLGLGRPARMHRRLRPVANLGLPVPTSLGHVTLAGTGAVWLCPLVKGVSLLYWAGPALPDSSDRQRQLLSPALDSMIALHRSGWAHGDFKWGNILYDGNTGQCSLVDVDSLHPADKGRFDVSRARDLARFLLDCEEAGVAAPLLSDLPARYAELAAIPAAEILLSLATPLEKLRDRHRRRYGEGHRLVPPGF